MFILSAGKGSKLSSAIYKLYHKYLTMIYKKVPTFHNADTHKQSKLFECNFI